jgi:hypothetical protein
MIGMVHSAIHRAVINFSAATLAMLVTVLGDIAAPIVSANWLIDIRTVCSVGGIVLTATWWLGRRFQNIEDRLKNAELARAQMQEDLGELIRAHRARRH